MELLKKKVKQLRASLKTAKKDRMDAEAHEYRTQVELKTALLDLIAATLGEKMPEDVEIGTWDCESCDNP